MNRTGPHFLGIGAQRSATTWLHEQLSQHRGIWLPPKKELHYFSRATRWPTPSFLASDSLLQRFIGSGKQDRHFRRHFARDTLASLRHGRLNELRWLLRYYLGPRDIEAYCRLFPQRPGLLTGEICPAYAVLDTDSIRGIAQRLPRLKILLMLRNPVDRLWSSLRYSGRLHGAADLIEATRGFALSEAQTLRSDYPGTIERWSAVFGEQNLHIGFFDQVRTEPLVLLGGVHRFLELETDSAPPAAAASQVSNAAQARDMPAEVRQMLSRLYRPQLQVLSERYGGYCSQWLQEAEGWAT